MTTTQPFMDEARELRQRVLWESNSSIQHIATALSAAYQRGREEERERCAKLTEGIGAEIEVHSLNLSETMLGKSISSIATAIRTQRDKG